MHGTNGFAFLLACLVGKKLLPAYEREKIGIPTTTGEAEFCIKNEEELYHDNWQHFVSSIPLDRISSSTLKIISGYARESCNRFKCDYNDVITKFSYMHSRKIYTTYLKKLIKKNYHLLTIN